MPTTIKAMFTTITVATAKWLHLVGATPMAKALCTLHLAASHAKNIEYHIVMKIVSLRVCPAVPAPHCEASGRVDDEVVLGRLEEHLAQFQANSFAEYVQQFDISSGVRKQQNQHSIGNQYIWPLIGCRIQYILLNVCNSSLYTWNSQCRIAYLR